MRTCSICEQGVLEGGASTKALSRGETTVVLKGVPTLICNVCNSKFFDEATTELLLTELEQAETAHHELVVREFVASFPGPRR
jgi:YgiT-type zinc finger domain-containing protein